MIHPDFGDRPGRAAVPALLGLLGVLLVAFQFLATTSSPIVYVSVGIGAAWLVAGGVGVAYAIADRDAFVPALAASLLAYPSVALAYHLGGILVVDASPSLIDAGLLSGFPVVALGLPLGIATTRREQRVALGTIGAGLVLFLGVVGYGIVTADGIGWALLVMVICLVALAAFTIPAFPAYRAGVVLRSNQTSSATFPRRGALAVSVVLLAILALLLPLEFFGVLGLGTQLVGILIVVAAIAVVSIVTFSR